MDPAEYANLERVEQNHWYYSGKRVLARWWLDRHAIFRGERPRLLDCGAGTGRFVAEMTDTCDVWRSTGYLRCREHGCADAGHNEDAPSDLSEGHAIHFSCAG